MGSGILASLDMTLLALVVSPLRCFWWQCQLFNIKIGLHSTLGFLDTFSEQRCSVVLDLGNTNSSTLAP